MKININEPCHENWNHMKPNSKGAFCLSCQKNVIDFTTKSIEQIKDFFNELPQSNNVCGRFKEKQLNEISFEHFFNEFLSWRFIKRAAVIFYLSLGAVMFSSCSNEDDDKVGKMQVIPDTASIAKQVQDSIEKQLMVVGEPAIEKSSDTAAINKKTKLITETLVKELNPKETKKEKVNEIAPGKVK